MTNFEAMGKRIRLINNMTDGGVAVDKETHYVVNCHNIDCIECLFFDNSSKMSCDKQFIEWLYQPYVQHLTKEEKALCTVLKDGFLARDAGGELYWYALEPEWKENVGRFESDPAPMLYIDEDTFQNCHFYFIEEGEKVRVNDYVA